MVDQIEQFSVSYNMLSGKKFKLKSQDGPKRGMAIIKEGIKSFKKEHNK